MGLPPPAGVRGKAHRFRRLVVDIVKLNLVTNRCACCSALVQTPATDLQSVLNQDTFASMTLAILADYPGAEVEAEKCEVGSSHF